MKKISFLITILFSLSCGTLEEENTFRVEPPPGLEEVWVCHNPWTDQHGKVCTDECFEQGLATRYCWLLEREDCIEELSEQWQKDSCSLLD